MVKDLNKRIDTINYNYLNLPIYIGLGQHQGKKIHYSYTAGGEKLRKKAYNNGSLVTKIDYIGAFVYENDTLQFIQTSVGRIVPQGDTYRYEYALKDHLGNIRVMFDQRGKILQDQSYYPFGMSIGEELTYNMLDNLPENKYLYNGKELQKDFDLGWYDYGARFYDPALGRWHVVDPMCEIARRWAPYQYAYNNPIRFIDPDGMVVDDYFNRDGKYLGSDEANSDYVKVIDQETWDKNKIIAKDGTESIDHKTGNNNSESFSIAGLDTESTLNVNDHYNPTDVDLVPKQNETGDGGMTIVFDNKTGEREIQIKIVGNNRTGISDDANVIINMFVHEEQHNNDYNGLGSEGYNTLGKNVQEQRAVSTQMKHESFKKIENSNPSYIDKIKDYGFQYGLPIPIKPKTIKK